MRPVIPENGPARLVSAWLLWLRRLAAFVLVVGLAACTTSGTTFDTSSMDLLIPGQTTLDEASALLKSEPTDVYRQKNGAATARWAHHSSLLTDAIYYNRELWLYFDETGVFRRIVKSNNVPMAEQKIGKSHHPATSTAVQPASASQPVASQPAGAPQAVPLGESTGSELIVIPGNAQP
ncbi:MAG TPA: hypothetical protein VK104_00490 [Burkholderiaceae bacterium]|nr:hypothetical protein [Burkholderiaceae bacterium]